MVLHEITRKNTNYLSKSAKTIKDSTVRDLVEESGLALLADSEAGPEVR